MVPCWNASSNREFYEGICRQLRGSGEFMPNIGRHQEQNKPGEGEQKLDVELSHVAILRAARVRHKAIGRGLQQYFDSVVAERIPSEFVDILNGEDRLPA